MTRRTAGMPTLCPVCRTDTVERRHDPRCVMAYMREVLKERHRPHQCTMFKNLEKAK